MAEVVLERVHKRYANGAIGLHDLSLTVADGECLVLVGPSGSGKTTTLRLIAGLEMADSGSIRIGGRAVETLPPRERDVAMVFQGHSLYPHLNVRDNLAFGLRLREGGFWKSQRPWRWLWPKREQASSIDGRVDAWARTLELQDLVDRMPDQLSGGERQRVALGRALVREPAVFLLDEPLGHLEMRLRSELRSQLHLLQRRIRATMVYVTHDPVEAMTLGERIVVLRNGSVEQVGTPDAVYAKPRNRFVATFLGWPPMHFLEGCLQHEDGRLVFGCEDWRLPVPVEQVTSWQEYVGREVSLGIRSDALKPAEAADQALRMEVVMIETLGSTCWVSYKRGQRRLTGSAGNGRRVEVGSMVDVTIDLERCRLFERASGLALGAGGRER